MLDVAIDVLGPVQVRVDGATVEVAARKQRVVLALLAVHGDAGVATDRLIEEVWEADPPEGGRATLQAYISTLRRLLPRDAVETTASGYRLAPGCSVDLHRFRAAVSTGKDEQALVLWRGEFAEDLRPHSVLDAYGVTMAEEQLTHELEVLARLVDSAPTASVGRLYELMEAQPFDDRPVELLMTALARSGRPVEAVRAYQAHRDRLLDDVGMEPGQGIVELERRIVGGDSQLAAPSGPTAVTASVDAASEFSRPAPPDNLYIAATDLVASVREAVASHRLVTLVGPGGSGKTRLVLELTADEAMSEGWAMVDLAELADGEPERVQASVLDVAERLSRLAGTDGLAGAAPLLVVDNAEVDVDVARGALAIALADYPSIRVLCLTRLRLGAFDEHVVWMDSLGCEGAAAASPAASLLSARIEALGGVSGELD
ncbi:MAG: BTAD domain-containing putative transcriptional regulator, partial [Actinomycetota bacterium]|nr:BTAD domain-containing putative transcriptional regulator [Actinomycetota bacterium]